MRYSFSKTTLPHTDYKERSHMTVNSNAQLSLPLTLEDTDTVQKYTGVSEFVNDVFTIDIDYSRDSNLSTAGKITLKEGGYMTTREQSPQQAFARASIAYASNQAHAQRLYDYASKCWFMFATPVLSSAANPRGLPISCMVSKVDDSRDGIGEHFKDILWMSTEGSGVGADWSSVRSIGTSTSRGVHTPGVMPFLHAVDAITLASIQGGVRRGATAVYLDVSHPEIMEFIEGKKITGGDSNRKITNIHPAVNITDAFMEAVIKGGMWKLVDPHSKEVKELIPARQVWEKILAMRLETGHPYLHFIDTANRALPQPLKDKGLKINSSNLCVEIELPTTPDRTAVCCLSSVNLEFYDDWKDNPLFIRDIMEMLDNVLTVFINKAPPELDKAVLSAKNERSVGLGAMGFHLYLQTKGVPFESAMASSLNRSIFAVLKSLTEAANFKLGSERGEAPDMVGTGKRFSLTQAIAPNASSGILCNTSPSIEPFNANAFVQKTNNGAFLMKNKALDSLFKGKYRLEDERLEETWDSVIANSGSVQHLDFLTVNEKDVFKTAFELDQQWVVDHAGSRAQCIDQGQSVNLFVHPDAPASYIHALHKQAWEKGLKGLYYLRSKNLGNMVKSSEYVVKECMSCQG